MNGEIPIIDLGPFLHGDTEERAAVAQEICHAAEHVGFIYLKNFGMSPDLMDAAFAVSRAFFASEEKHQVPFDPECNHGFTQMLGEALDPSKPADLKETFTSRDLARIPSGAEYWSSEVFEAFMRVLHKRISMIASDVMRAFALALELPDSFFDERHTGLTQTLRLLHYPPTESVAEGQLGAGAHTDYGTLTVLFQDDSGGLQVQDLDGNWVDAPPIPGTVVINTGDLLARWSNDRFRSTPHRVQPRAQARKLGRQSIAFFSDPDPDVGIDAIPSCVTEARPATYKAITAGAYIHQRIMDSQAS